MNRWYNIFQKVISNVSIKTETPVVAATSLFRHYSYLHWTVVSESVRDIDKS